MEATHLDAVEFRAGQRRDWGSAAKGWHDWQELIVSATAEVSRRLVEIAGIQAGDRVLDVYRKQSTVVEIDPKAEHGLGKVKIRYDDGREVTFMLAACGLTPIQKSEQGP